MTIFLTELESFTPINNKVVVIPVVDTSKYRYGNIELHSPVSLVDGKPFDAFKSAPVVCRVVCSPRRLIFGTRKVHHETVEQLDVPIHVKMRLYEQRREAKYTETTMIDVPIPGSMMWKTPIQVKANDVVWVNANAILHADKIECEGKEYLSIPYDSMYLKKSGDDVTMLNGYVLAELVEDNPSWQKRMEKAGLVVPEMIKRMEHNDRIGLIRYIGDPVEYLFEDRFDYQEIKAGDMVMFKWKINRRLEPGQKFFGKDVDMIVTRRANILAIIN